MSRKDKIDGVSELGRNLVNFQLTWAAAYYLGLALSSFFMNNMMSSGEVRPSVVLAGMYLTRGVKLTVWGYRYL